MTDAPSGAAAVGMASMFKNAQGVNISGSSFRINVNTGNETSLEVLHKRVAPNAILNAGGRADEVRCHPGTREEVVDRIEKWGDGQDGQTVTEPIFWLSGPAGAGKSSIVQTVAERYEEHGVPHANFFFFRGDASRSHASPLVATLVHQIIALYPTIRELIATLLYTNPLILDATFDKQLIQLIVEPLCSIQESSVTDRRLLLLIDGLDECDSEAKRSQQQILLAFDKVFAQYGESCPFRLLVASRAESQIQMGFNKITSQCLRLFLDEKYSPEKDIRLFVNAKFEEVRRTHPLANMLDANWPSVDDVNYIVKKSSGQFIFGATVMRFILDSSASPAISLERVKGAARLATKSPFSHLDAIYIYILSEVDDQQLLKDILHAQLLSNKTARYSIHKFLEIYNQNYSKATVVSCVADLTSIARYNQYNGILEFYHASFSDFLSDKSRSSLYFVDLVAFNRIVVPILWKHHQNLRTDSDAFYSAAAKGTLLLETLLPDLLNMVVSSKGWPQLKVCDVHADILVKIYELCVTDDDVANFRHIFHQWIIKYNIDCQYHHYYTIQCIPFTDRYIQMERTQRILDWAPTDEGHTSLCPQTEFDRSELALWLKNLLAIICQRYYDPGYTRLYKDLLKSWIDWIIAHGIPLNSQGNDTVNFASQDVQQSINIPYSNWYFTMARAQYDQPPDSGATAVLHPETDDDRKELGLWFKGILHQIYSKVYPHDAKHYKELLRAWIYWAVSTGIHIGGYFKPQDPWRRICDMPHGDRYLTMVRMGLHQPPDDKTAAALHLESDADREEIAAWVNDLLKQIYSKIHSHNSEDYKRLRKTWISWALQNNIPCQNRRYLAMASADHRKPPDDQISQALCSETDSDLQELGVWFRDLLREIHTDIFSHDTERYKQLWRAWIYWGVSKGIPMNDLSVGSDESGGLRQSIPMPYSDWYLTMARADCLQPPDKKIIDKLCPETDADLVELGIWFRSVLDEIHSKVYPSNAERYEELMKAWVSWAVWNNIPCQNLDNLPGAELYIRRSKAWKWVASLLAEREGLVLLLLLSVFPTTPNGFHNIA